MPISSDQIVADDFPDDYDDDDEIFDNDDDVEKSIPSESATIETEKADELNELTDVPEGTVWGDSVSESSDDKKGEQEVETETLPEEVSKMEKVETIDDGNEEEEEQVEEIAEEEELDLEGFETLGDENEVGDENEETPSLTNPETDEPVEEPSETINDQFATPKETIAENAQEKKGSSMMELISVNYQFMFVKELFKDDQVSFQNALYELEEYDSFDDAVEFLVQGYAKEFNWDMQSTEVKELLKVLFRKFRDGN